MNKEMLAGRIFLLGCIAVTLGAGLLWGWGAAALSAGAFLIFLAIGVVLP